MKGVAGGRAPSPGGTKVAWRAPPPSHSSRPRSSSGFSWALQPGTHWHTDWHSPIPTPLVGKGNAVLEEEKSVITEPARESRHRLGRGSPRRVAVGARLPHGLSTEAGSPGVQSPRKAGGTEVATRAASKEAPASGTAVLLQLLAKGLPRQLLGAWCPTPRAPCMGVRQECVWGKRPALGQPEGKRATSWTLTAHCPPGGFCQSALSVDLVTLLSNIM